MSSFLVYQEAYEEKDWEGNTTVRKVDFQESLLFLVDLLSVKQEGSVWENSLSSTPKILCFSVHMKRYTTYGVNNMLMRL